MTSLYVALSAQMATERRMATIANNVANMNTPGFRAEEIRFEDVLSGAGDGTRFVSSGQTYTSLRAGPVVQTGNAFDVAPQGDAWFGIQTPAGTAYTRDGRFHLSETGQLLTVENHPVLDAGGTELMLDPGAGEVHIAADGAISQGGNRLGSLGLFTLAADAKLSRYGGAVIPDKPAEPVQDFTSLGVRQGYIEGSNVDPVTEMTRLINVQRAFEMASQAVQQGEDSTAEAIRTLAPSS
ncbi:flagellar basal-body rod protein FlgF [Prosthecomicrobium pneumaticum]|uniref:Flagellar basal-body rod protein FlgF n=1 Tax=Prosthecomicrobium pneumaticum TaxID=81895 RepID=A0A7W9CSC9_9HYPH|nr:flagellar basal-body rod protein FlgF [Prosthecomicrobium pneumaticum]MBB5751035.1 flagellar basal-body rod protein FlgF [Prosthecomicrobium pneumaticum]